jgi:hypothetical protein
MAGEDQHEKAKEPNPENYDLMLEGGSDYRRAKTMPAKEDPNRDWLWSWDKTEKFPMEPFGFPENRAARDFIKKHQNIAVALSMHNYGQSIIRATFQANDTKSDIEVFDDIMKHGQQLLPGLTAVTKWNPGPYRFGRDGDLAVRGEEINWMFGKQGVYSFLLELSGPCEVVSLENNEQGHLWHEMQAYNDELLFGDGFIPWHEVDDPGLGRVEIGGWKKNMPRLEAGFLIEAHAHRAMAFSVYCARQTPTLSIKKTMTEDKGDGRREVTATIVNAGLIPTHSDVDLTWAITRPDWITLNTRGKVLGAARFNTISLESFNTAEQQDRIENRSNPTTRANI